MECGEKVLETPSGTPESSATGLFQRQWRVYRKVVDNNYLFHREALFVDKRVRIFAHDDCSGYGGAATWAATLKAAGAAVDSFGFTGSSKAMAARLMISTILHASTPINGRPNARSLKARSILCPPTLRPPKTYAKRSF